VVVREADVTGCYVRCQQENVTLCCVFTISELAPLFPGGYRSGMDNEPIFSEPDLVATAFMLGATIFLSAVISLGAGWLLWKALSAVGAVFTRVW
jgi:hypothetical protein